MTAKPARPGLRRNLAQFSLLVLVNAFVGARVGLERSILPALAEHAFQIAARTRALSRHGRTAALSCRLPRRSNLR